MRLLTVPNWSFGRDKALLGRCRDLLAESGLSVHFCASDVDHNRTVTAFSGEASAVFGTIVALAEEILPSIDLNRHVGVHPRIGGLDVCPFIQLDDTPLDDANASIATLASLLADRWGLPIYLYEKSEKGRHEADLPTLRKGGFGGLAGKALSPDFGPTYAHPQLGVTVLGVRDPLIAMNVDLRTVDISLARGIAKSIRYLRSEGDVRFLGVRALGLPLASRDLTQVSMNLTLPDLTGVDPIVEWVAEQAGKRGVQIDGVELIGVIRPVDLERATRLMVQPSQIVDSLGV